MTENDNGLREAALSCLLMKDPLDKVKQTQKLYRRWQEETLSISKAELSVPDIPGQPEKPELVAMQFKHRILLLFGRWFFLVRYYILLVWY